MMNIERFKALADAYGANLARWPEAERQAAMAFADASPDARRLLDEAAALDRVLDAAETVAVTRALENRILAAFPQRKLSAGGAGWLGIFAAAPARWAQAAALAGSLALGLLVGAALPGLAGVGEGGHADPALIALGGDDSDIWNELGEGS